ncbi:MAG TPA: UbiD family decarboxylase [Planctomycetota bacterium]|jgi:UbiD family decarboxylase
MNIRSIVDRYAASGQLRVHKEPAAKVWAAAALINQAAPAPILLENVDGHRVLANILANRRALAEHLGVAPERFLPELLEILEGKSARPGAGLVRTGKVYGEVEIPPADWGKLPILTFYRGDGGPYLTAGVWIVRDPKNGVNLSYHRMMMTAANRATVRIVESRGTDTAIKNSGGKLEAAICISAPANVLFAGALSPAADVNELELAARFGRVELARCKTVDLEVPADCEMVIEGRFTGETGPEGQFVDITGTIDFVRTQPVFEITRVSGKKNAIHYTVVPASADHLTLMGIPKELDMYREIGKVCDCKDVVVTPGGACWLHSVVKIAKRGPDDGQRALEAAFKAHKSLKHCIVVDEDIDITNATEVEWAVATRFQADRSLLLLKDQPSSSLDPSAYHEHGKKSRGAKLGLDATIPWGADRSLFEKVKA